MVLRSVLKSAAFQIFRILTLPSAALAGFGRFNTGFTLFAHVYCMIPGILGDYLRVAYYSLTLTSCHPTARIEFGSFFAHPQATVAANVYIGAYSILGHAHIGERAQIASGVQILSGGHQHSRDTGGQILGAEQGKFGFVEIGADCWIGAGSIVMADIGQRTTIGAGSIVTRPIPAESTAVGNPARVILR